MMMKKFLAGSMLAAAAVAAMAAVTFDAATGTGFVGKGDVQLVYNWNNKGLQDNASLVRFQVSAMTVSESSWECRNEHNANVQQRSRTTTTSTQGVVSHIARERNQITGFILTGYESGGGTTTTTDGPPVNSCPAEPSTWYLSQPAGDPVVTSTGGDGLQVSIDGTNWFPIPQPAAE